MGSFHSLQAVQKIIPSEASTENFVRQGPWVLAKILPERVALGSSAACRRKVAGATPCQDYLQLCASLFRKEFNLSTSSLSGRAMPRRVGCEEISRGAARTCRVEQFLFGLRAISCGPDKMQISS